MLKLVDKKHANNFLRFTFTMNDISTLQVFRQLCLAVLNIKRIQFRLLYIVMFMVVIKWSFFI